jgi:hypothetical protein
MPDTLHIRIKKEYAAELLNDLVKAEAVELVEPDVIELSAAQQAALDKELQTIRDNPSYLHKLKEVEHTFKKAR